MTWSIPIGTVSGTVIRVHVTFFLLLLWIAITYYSRGGTQAAIQGVTFVVLVFACVVLHEFGHVLAARRYGVETPDITLLPIGGVARLARMPENPGQELVIALAGPAVNVVIAALLYFVLGALPTLAGTDLQNPGTDMLERLASVNVFLFLFNLVPAFPMDGGRVLRALLAYRMGYAQATQVATSIGQGVAFLFGLLGLFGNPLLLFIALFVYLAATAEAHSAQMRQAERGILAAVATVTRFESLSPVSRFADAVQALVRTTQHEFPVVDGAGRLLGVLTREAMIRALTEHGPDVAVTEIMTRDIPVVQPRQSLEHAIQLLRETGSAVVGVVDAAGQLVGLIRPENIGGILMLHAAKPRRPTAGPRGQTVTSPQSPWPLSYRNGGRSPGSRQSRRVLLGPLDPKKRLDADHVARVRSRRSDRTRAARGCDAKEAVGRLHKMASTAGGDPSTLSITAFGAPADPETFTDCERADIQRAAGSAGSEPRRNPLCHCQERVAHAAGSLAIWCERRVSSAMPARGHRHG